MAALIRMALGALIGVAIIGLGIYAWYIYMTTFIDGGNHWLFIGSLLQIGVGIFILFRASQSTEKPLQSTPTNSAEQNFGSFLQRNNEIIKEYKETSATRDKLELIRARAEEVEKEDPFKG